MSLTGRTFQFNTTLTGNDMVGAGRMESDQGVEFFTTPYQSISSCMLLYTVEGNDIWMGCFPVNGEDYEDMYINGTWEDDSARTITFTAEPNYFPEEQDATMFEAWILANATEVLPTPTGLTGRTFKLHDTLTTSSQVSVGKIVSQTPTEFFQSNSTSCYGIGTDQYGNLYYSPVATSSIQVYTPDDGWIVDDAYKTISFTSEPNTFLPGQDIDDFITWLDANADEVVTNYVVSSTQLTSIANAIRLKGGTSASLAFPTGFVSAIQDIPSGGGGGDELFLGMIQRTFTAIEYSGSCYIASRAFASFFTLTQATFPECTSIYGSAFHTCSSLTTISFPKCEFIDQYAFFSCTSLESAIFPECSYIGSFAFSNCSSLAMISFSKCEIIDNGAFSKCQLIASADFPECTLVASNVFNGCTNLSYISFPNCISIKGNAFYSCSSLTAAIFPECVSVSSSAFYGCNNISFIDMPKCEMVSQHAFYNCTALTSVSLPACKTIGSSAFYNCSLITEITLPKCNTISTSAFQNCSALMSVYLPGSSRVNLLSSAFVGTPIDDSSYTGTFGSIFVPSSMWDAYMTAGNWSNYISRLVSV